MAASSNSAYLGQGHIISLILAIIPITNIILGFVCRFTGGNIILAILNLIFAPIFYIVDLVSVLLNNNLEYLV